MSALATHLVLTVEANGGQFLVDGTDVVIRPGDAAMALLEELRANKSAIMPSFKAEQPQDVVTRPLLLP